MLKKIVSGGQTGVDRAALDAAIDTAFPHGGYCPKGREAEDGVIPAVYQLQEIDGGYRQRTKLNVQHSDATAVFYSSQLTGGTEQTVLFLIKEKKPYKLIDINLVLVDDAVSAMVAFIGEFEVQTLNVAGPRFSSCPQAYEFVKQVICSSSDLI